MNYPASYGSYTLLESIGKGGMSAIELAQTSVADAQYVRFLAIKRMQNHLVLDDSYIRMFQDEARINSELQHSNIAQVYDFGQIEDEFFIAMEYIPGVDLREVQKALARQSKGIPIPITLRILYEVLRALEYAHTRVDTFGRPMNIVHRDVNPRNVMLSIRGEVKLIDFGVAKAETKLDKTVGHMLKGKFAYMSPEQFEGTSVDSRSDLFAMGLVLHEMVEGTRPFRGLSEVQIMHRILAGNINPLTGPRDHPQPELVQTIHQRALARDVEQRYASASLMIKDIERAAEACGGMASPTELASFLFDALPKRSKEIYERLDAYRREITDSVSIDLPSTAVSVSQSTDVETLVVPSETVSRSFSVLSKKPDRTVLVFSLFGVLAILVLIAVLQNKPQPSPVAPTPSKTAIQGTEQPLLSDPQPESPEPILPKKEVVSQKDNNRSSSTKTANNNNEKPRNQNRSTVQKAPEQKVQPPITTPPAVPSVPAVAEPVAPVTTPAPTEVVPKPQDKPAQNTKPPPVNVRVYLSVGVESGTKDIPVLLNGRQITTTGSKKMIQMEVGNHTLTVINPDNGKRHTEQVTITQTTKQHIVRIKGL